MRSIVFTRDSRKRSIATALHGQLRDHVDELVHLNGAALVGINLRGA